MERCWRCGDFYVRILQAITVVCREGATMTYQQDHLTQTIIKCIIKVHKTLGPGFLESIYRKALMLELQKTTYPSRWKKKL